MITDDEYNGQGMVVKNVSLPAIKFHDTFAGWRSHGFVPITANALPNSWYVQLISYTNSGITVSRLPLSAANSGSISIDPAKQGLKKLVISIFTAVPKTTKPAKFTLAVSRQS